MDIKGQDEIFKAYAENTREVKSIVKDIKNICTLATQISESKRQELFNLTTAIYKMQIRIRDLIAKKLDLEMWQEINRNKL